MLKELKDQWLVALRSGEYIQNRGNLRAPFHRSDAFDSDDPYHEDIADETSHCCLGVLAEIMAKHTDSYIVQDQDWGFQYLAEVYDEDDFGTGESEWEDFDGEDLPGTVLGSIELSHDFASKLIAMNDGGDGWRDNAQSFTQIADWIEINL